MYMHRVFNSLAAGPEGNEYPFKVGVNRTLIQTDQQMRVDDMRQAPMKSARDHQIKQ